MSFDFNLSSDEESVNASKVDEPFHASLCTDEVCTSSSLLVQTRQYLLSFADVSGDHDSFHAHDGDDENNLYDHGAESVDWEDVETTDPAAVIGESDRLFNETRTLRPVTINMNEGTANEPSSSAKTKKRQRIQRSKFRIESLPNFLQSLLWDLQRAHLLCLTSRAIQISQLCSQSEIMALACSLIPQRWALCTDTSKPPSLQLINEFNSWYFDLVNRTEVRRRRQAEANRAAGAPQTARGRRKSQQKRNTKLENSVLPAASSEWCGLLMETTISSLSRLEDISFYLSSTHDEDPQLLLHTDNNDERKVQFSLTRSDRNQLLVAMIRSLGWRARYVQAMDPIPPDVDVDHPLVASAADNFFRLLKNEENVENAQLDPSDLKTAVSTQKGRSFVVDNAPGMLPERVILGWVEILCEDNSSQTRPHRKWIHVDPTHELVNEPSRIETLLFQQLEGRKQRRQITESSARRVIPYIIAVEHNTTPDGNALCLTDVTPRYVHSWVASLRLRGEIRGKRARLSSSPSDASAAISVSPSSSWWAQTIQIINSSQQTKVTQMATGKSGVEAIVVDSDVEKSLSDDDDDIAEIDEHNELVEAANNEAIPTSKAAFQSHPIYVIPSVLCTSEVLAPDAGKRICGVYKGEMVYRRSDVSTAWPERKWPYLGRKVKEGEKPVKRLKARKKPVSRQFKALKSYGAGLDNEGSIRQGSGELNDSNGQVDDGMEDLFGLWQTDPWSPAPVGPSDPIPVNEYNNVELRLLNPGLAHIDERGVAPVAKNLGIPYAPCLVGFEGHGGNRTPTIRGIVVHIHNEDLLREAMGEVTMHEIATEHENRRHGVLLKWKKLLVGLLTKDRLDREYG